MRLTSKLISRLSKPFSRDPQKFLAFRVNYPGGLIWTVQDEVLTLKPISPAYLQDTNGDALLDSTGNQMTDSYGTNGITIPLGPGVFALTDANGAPLLDQFDQEMGDYNPGYTLSTLVDYINTFPNYSAFALDSTRSGLSARVLLDGTGNQLESNGDHLYGYSSIHWALEDAYAAELVALQTQIANAPSEMSIGSADGEWIDYIGSFFGIKRTLNELDPVYGPRIVATTVQPKCNNVAIEIMIETATGQVATVTDVGSGAKFDCTIAFDLINGDPSTYSTNVQALITGAKAAGTSLRNLTLGGGSLADILTAPTDFTDTLILNRNGVITADTIEGIV